MGSGAARGGTFADYNPASGEVWAEIPDGTRKDAKKAIEAAAAVYQMTGEILPSDHGKVSMVVRQPLGIVTVISPWNFPLLLSSRGLAVALAVGNAVVLKPSEETPLSGGLLIAELFFKTAKC